jgi:hypothetical protein
LKSTGQTILSSHQLFFIGCDWKNNAMRALACFYNFKFPVLSAARQIETHAAYGKTVERNLKLRKQAEGMILYGLKIP